MEIIWLHLLCVDVNVHVHYVVERSTNDDDDDVGTNNVKLLSASLRALWNRACAVVVLVKWLRPIRERDCSVERICLKQWFRVGEEATCTHHHIDSSAAKEQSEPAAFTHTLEQLPTACIQLALLKPVVAAFAVVFVIIFLLFVNVCAISRCRLHCGTTRTKFWEHSSSTSTWNCVLKWCRQNANLF